MSEEFALIRGLVDSLAPGSAGLELGCGTGWILLDLVELCPHKRFVCLDIDTVFYLPAVKKPNSTRSPMCRSHPNDWFSFKEI